jgi:hypothetical protein
MYVYAGCAPAELDVPFLGDATDNGPHNHPVTLRGASTHEYGLTFDSGTDSFAEISNFIYADDSSFTIAMWISKEKCRSTAAEVLYSHSQDMDSSDLRNSRTSNLNIQLLCESAGAGRPEFDISSLSGTAIRCEWPTQGRLRVPVSKYVYMDTKYSRMLRADNLMDRKGVWATFDYQLHSSGQFSKIDSQWVHLVLVVSSESLRTYANGKGETDS